MFLTGNIRFILVHLLMNSYSPVMFSVGKQCFSTEHFRQKYPSSGVLRIQGNTGPFRCAGECLIRRSCHSVNFDPGKALCALLYLQQADTSYSTPSASQLHIEKSQMPSMVNVHPCNDSACGDNERCEVLFNNNVICSITECSPLRMHQLWRPRHTHALAVGTEVEYYCLSHPALQTHVLKCNQNGAWRTTHETKENIQRCNRYECVRHSNAIYIERTNRCYVFVNMKTTHRDAQAYCRASFVDAHLFLVDTMDKVGAVKDNVIPLLFDEDPFVWVDGIYNKSLQTVDTWRGKTTRQQLGKLQAYANIGEDAEPGCFALFPLVSAVAVKDCQEAFVFICEIDVN